MTVELWFFPSVIALIGWGFSAFLPKLALRGLDPLHLMVYASTFSMFLMLCMVPFWGWPSATPQGIMVAVLTGLASAVAQFLYLTALRRGPVSYVTMVSSLYPIVAIFLAFVWIDEPITARQLLGIALGVASIVMLVSVYAEE